jgi:type I restriction enzyme S subunit
MTTTIPLKWVASMTAGGTPSVEEADYWSDGDDGYPWVAISDMSSVDTVTATARRVSNTGLRAARLALGEPGTILFSMYASLGHTAWLDSPAAWNQAILGLRANSATDARFLRYCLISLRPQLIEQARSNTQANLNAEVVGNLRLPHPPLDEQRRIADFLGAETARIDRMIRLRLASRSLVNEKEFATISQLATVGTGPAQQTRNPWIPIIGAGWEVLPLKRRWRVIDCKHRTPTYIQDGYPVISPGDISPGRLNPSVAHRFVDEDDYRDLADPLRRPRPGDIVYGRNASVGTAAFVDTEKKFTMGQDVCRITSAHEDQLFLSYFLNTVAHAQLGSLQIGSTFTRINIGTLLELSVACPPPEEQRHLASEMDSVSEQASRLTSAIDRQVALLGERRQALITAAVTGQIGV